MWRLRPLHRRMQQIAQAIDHPEVDPDAPTEARELLMAQLTIRFAKYIYDYSTDIRRPARGPIFHRWLPDGQTDALVLKMPGGNVSMWFERRGKMTGVGYIEYDDKSADFDVDRMARQALLDGGALFGELTLTALTDAEYQAVLEERIGSEEYVTLGKRVVKDYLDPSIRRLTQLLREVFGQYWLGAHQAYDSRHYSLGHHCYLLGVKWLASDKTLHDFIPNARTHAILTATYTLGRKYPEYLSQQSWGQVRQLLETSYTPPLAAVIAQSAHRLADQGFLRQALVEAVTAADLAIEHRLKSGGSPLAESIGGFENLPLSACLVIAAANVPIPANTLTEAIRCIKIRNEVVHEGTDPPPTTSTALDSLLETISQLLGEPRIQYPSAWTGNELRVRPEDWEQ